MPTINIAVRDFPTAGTLRTLTGLVLEVQPFTATKSGTALVGAGLTSLPLDRGDGTLTTDPGYYWVSFRGASWDLSARRLIHITGDADLVDLWLAPIDPTTMTPTPAAIAGWEDALAGARPKACRVYRSGSQDTVTASVRNVDVNALEFNDDPALFVTDLDAGTVTLADGGLYLLSWSIKFGSATEGERYASVAVNGATVRESGQTTAGSFSASGSDSLRLAAGDVLLLRYYVDGGAAQINGAASYATGLGITRQGD